MASNPVRPARAFRIERRGDRPVVLVRHTTSGRPVNSPSALLALALHRGRQRQPRRAAPEPPSSRRVASSHFVAPHARAAHSARLGRQRP
jgi:hypothetical protein